MAAGLFDAMAVCALSTVAMAFALIDLGNAESSEASWPICTL